MAGFLRRLSSSPGEGPVSVQPCVEDGEASPTLISSSPTTSSSGSLYSKSFLDKFSSRFSPIAVDDYNETSASDDEQHDVSAGLPAGLIKSRKTRSQSESWSPDTVGDRVPDYSWNRVIGKVRRFSESNAQSSPPPSPKVQNSEANDHLFQILFRDH